jgi:thiamine-monophosphate kinase
VIADALSRSAPAHTGLGTGVEFDRIRAVWRRLGERAAHLGDDCALVEVGGEHLAFSTDLVVEGTHFRNGWLEPEALGWRAAAAALSDLAAVAAEPLGVQASVGMPTDWTESDLEDLMGGIADAAQSVGALVWGGDIVRSERVVIDVAVVGRTDRPLRRSGAAPGDEVWVTGELGGVAVALDAFFGGEKPHPVAFARFAHPEPRVQEAQWIRDRGAKAAIDLSDGLVGDAGHLAAASGVQVTLEREGVPVHAAARSADVAMVSGEEYELLVVLPRAAGRTLAAEFRDAFALPLSRVGRIEAGSGVRLLSGGGPVALPQGFTHFDP